MLLNGVIRVKSASFMRLLSPQTMGYKVSKRNEGFRPQLEAVQVKTLKSLITALEIKGRSKCASNIDRGKLIKNFLITNKQSVLKDLIIKNKTKMALPLHVEMIGWLDKYPFESAEIESCGDMHAKDDDKERDKWHKWIESFEIICFKYDCDEREKLAASKRYPRGRKMSLYYALDAPDFGEGIYLEDGVYLRSDGTMYDSKA